MNGNKDQGIVLKERYNIIGYPTTIYINADGSEIDRIFGWDDDVEKYYQTIVDYTSGKNTLHSFLAEVNQHPDNTIAKYRLAKGYVDRGLHERAKHVFQQFAALDPHNQSGHLPEVKGYLAVYHLYDTGDDQPLRSVLKQLKDDNILDLCYYHLLRYHKRNNHHAQVLDYYPQYISRFPDRAGLMNDYAWYIYKNRLKENYQEGISLAAKAVQLEPDAANIWDTLAWLEFEAGIDSLAIAHMTIAVEKSNNRDDYCQNLQKMLSAAQ